LAKQPLICVGLVRPLSKMSELKQEPAAAPTPENNAMQTENANVEDPNRPLTLPEKREKLRRMREHFETNEISFFDLDVSTREAYFNLEKEIKNETEKHNMFVAQLCDQQKLSTAHRDTVFNLLGASSVESAPLQNLMVDFVGANVELFEQQAKRYQALEEEHINLKRQIEQEALNANNKRARTPTSSLPSTYATLPKPQSWSAPLAQPTTPVANKSLTEQFNFIQRGNCQASMPLNNEKISAALNPRTNGYQMPREYKTQSAQLYAIFQDFTDACDSKCQKSLVL